MPFDWSIHHHEGRTAGAASHRTQDTFSERFLRYWFDRGIGQPEHLADAPAGGRAHEARPRAASLVAGELVEI